jgi:GTPase SAR1 family protein
MNASNSTPKRRETFRRKVIFVGEPQVGKTALIYDLKTGSGINQFVSSYLDGVDIEMNTPTRLPNEENGGYTVLFGTDVFRSNILFCLQASLS